MNKVLWRFEDVINVCRGIYSNSGSSCSISINTRSLKKGDLFIALKGKNFDGHDFIFQAFENGAVAAIAEYRPEGIPDEFPIFITEDSFSSFQDLASYIRNNSNAKIVGVTGSLGKTTIKEMANLMVSSLSKSYCSEGNFNNCYGLPLSLSMMPDDTEYGIFELGMNNSGEINDLAELLKPDIAVISCISEVHIGNFNSVEEIALAKSEIFNSVSKPEIAILNIDDTYFDMLKKCAEEKNIKKVISFGSSVNADFRLCDYSYADNGNCLNVEAEIYGEKFIYVLAARGKHNIYNSLCALAIVYALGLNVKQASLALKDIKTVEGRGNIKQIYFASGESFTLIDESYNASVASAEMAIDNALSLKKLQGGRLLVVLGDILELGSFSERLHKKLANRIKFKDIDALFSTGSEMKRLHEIVSDKIFSKHVDNIDSLIKALKNFIRPGDILMLKASNALNMKKVVDEFVVNSVE